MPKNSEIGDFLEFQHPFCRKTPKKSGRWTLCSQKIIKKICTMPKKFQSRPVLCATRKKGKTFWFNFPGQQVQFKICRTFGRTKSVTSDVSKNTDEKP